MTTLLAPPVPTALPPEAIDTIIAQTAGAAATQTAALLPPTLTPTLTPSPTRTPTQTPSPSPTFLFILATLSKTPTLGPASGELGCQLLEQSPGDDAHMAKRQSFTVSWKVQNTGTSTWNSNEVDFVYVSGDKLATVKAVDLPKSVEPGASVTLKVTMTAPADNGKYKTAWNLHQGKQEFCKVNISIIVP